MSDHDAFALLCQHVVLHLPDSLAGRQALLAALILRAPRNSPLLPGVREMQWHLEEHLRLGMPCAPGCPSPATALPNP